MDVYGTKNISIDIINLCCIKYVYVSICFSYNLTSTFISTNIEIMFTIHLTNLNWSIRVTLQFMPKLMLHDRACYFMSVKSLIFCQHHDTYLLRNRVFFGLKFQNNLRDLRLWKYWNNTWFFKQTIWITILFIIISEYFTWLFGTALYS